MISIVSLKISSCQILFAQCSETAAMALNAILWLCFCSENYSGNVGNLLWRSQFKWFEGNVWEMFFPTVIWAGALRAISFGKTNTALWRLLITWFLTNFWFVWGRINFLWQRFKYQVKVKVLQGCETYLPRDTWPLHLFHRYVQKNCLICFKAEIIYFLPP